MGKLAKPLNCRNVRKEKSRREIPPTYIPLFGCPYHYYTNRQFWCQGYYVDTVGRNKKAIAEYIRNQLAEDKMSDQLTIKEYYDTFTGEPTNKSSPTWWGRS